MTAPDLTDALRKLQAAGWPLAEFRTVRVSFALSMGRTVPSEFYPETAKETDLWVLEGWLRSQLRDKDYRQDIKTSKTTGRVRIYMWSQSSPFGFFTAWYDTELEALLEACLATVEADHA